jgi:putative effector of murein hydrolase
MTKDRTESCVGNFKIFLASGIVWFHATHRVYYGGPLALLESAWGFDGWKNIGLSLLVSIASLAICFGVLKYMFRPFIDNCAQAHLAGMRGAEAAIKVCVVGSVLHLWETTTYSQVPRSVTWTVAIALCLLWVLRDVRRPTLSRLAILVGVAWAAWLAEAQYLEQTSYLHVFVRERAVTDQVAFYRALERLAFPIQENIQAAFVGFFVGLLCTRQKFRGERRGTSLFSQYSFCNWLPRLFFGEKYSKASWSAGVLTSILLSTSFLALHAIVFQGFRIWPFRLIDLQQIISRVFEDNAVHNLPTALWSLSPFLVLGMGLTLVLNRFRINGVVPIVGCGALLGLLWSQNVSGLYRMMFLDIHLSAILGGMIIAAGFGASANLFGRTNNALAA